MGAQQLRTCRRMEAQNIIGEYYLDGTGVKQDEEKAVYWFEKSAKNGNSLSMFHLGECYYKGRGVQADTIMAIDWLKKAEAHGDRDAGRM